MPLSDLPPVVRGRGTRVLVIEDDREDYLLIRSALNDAALGEFSFDWARNYEEGLAALGRAECDVSLIGYRLGSRSGIDLLTEAVQAGYTIPIAIITGVGDVNHDAAMAAGAADSIARSEITGTVLQRVIRHSREHLEHLAELRRRDEWHRAILEYLSDSVLVFNAEARVTYASPAAVPLIGWTPEELVGQDGFALLHPEDTAYAQEWFAACLAQPGVPIHAAYRVRHKDGEYRPLEVIAVNRLDERSILGVVATFRDATERHRVQASSRRMVAILEAASDLVGSADTEGRLTYLNRAGRSMLGLPDETDITELTIRDCHPAWASELIIREALPAAERDGIWRGETELLGRSGREIPVSQVIVAHRAHDGTVEYYSTIARDISDRRATERALELRAHELREARDTLQTLIDSAPLAIFTLDTRGNVLTWNKTAEQIFGWREDEVVGRFIPFVSDEHLPEFRELLARASAGETLTDVELVRHCKDGSKIDITVYATPMRAPDGQVQSILGLVADNRYRRSLEAQLRTAQKMEAVGQLAGGIAHDFNNLLTAILAPADFLLHTLPADHEAVRDLRDIRDAARRAADLTKQLLAFSRRQVLEPRSISLGDVVTGMESMLRRLIGEHIELHTIPADDLGTVRADPGQLEQVLVNLVVNARDAMPDGGKLTIETANVELDESYAAEHYPVTPGSYVMLAVTDTGEGMTADTKSHLWEPFFTTKPTGRGTGLGLATVFGIVKQSGGYIWVYSEPGQGSTFKIYLPRIDAPAESLAVVSKGALPHGSQTLLVVEDDDMVRAVTRRALTAHGYTVLAASNGPEALLLAGTHGYKMDMLLTDVIMPGMSGRELAERLRQVRPDLKVLFISGYTDDTIVRHGVLEGGVPFLQKPFTPDQLLRKVQGVIAA